MIRAWSTGAQWQIDIVDHGIGIPDKDLPHLGERYFRGSNVGSFSGTGVGLFLVHQVLALHRATLHIGATIPHGTHIHLSFDSW